MNTQSFIDYIEYKQQMQNTGYTPVSFKEWAIHMQVATCQDFVKV